MVNGEFSGPDSFGDQGFLWVLPDLVLIIRTSHLFLLLYFPILTFLLLFFTIPGFLPLAMGTSLSGTTGAGLIVGSVNNTNKSFLRSDFY